TTTKVGVGITVPSNTFSVSPKYYDAGTVCSVASSGSSTCSGTSTTFLWSDSGSPTWTTSGAAAGDIVIFADGNTSTISSITDNTHLTLGGSVNEPSGTH